MRAIILITLIFLCTPFTGLYAQTGQQPSKDSPGTDDKSKQPQAMKLYDVPAAPSGSDQSPEESADYLKLQQIRAPKEGVVLIEEFLKKYPNSKFAPTVRMGAVSMYQELNNYEKIVEHGEQILTSAPSNIRVLTILALAYSTHEESKKAVERASKAISTLDNLPKPSGTANATDRNAEKDVYLAMNYAVLGSTFLSEYEQARKKEKEVKADTGGAPIAAPGSPTASQGEAKASVAPSSAPAASVSTISLAKAFGYLSKAVELMPRYEFAQYQLGVVFAYRNEADGAMDAFAKTVAIGGGFAPSAQKNLEAVYKLTHKNSLEGLENLVAKAKEELGLTAPAKIEQSPPQP
jgi:tetratricopeptide (TPR) repeat protein